MADYLIGPAVMFICYNRCLICGRRTTHEVCHAHSHAIHGEKAWKHPGMEFDAWQRDQWEAHFNDSEEVCERNWCPQTRRDWQ